MTPCRHPHAAWSQALRCRVCPDCGTPRTGTEEQFLQVVRELAHTLGWRTYHTRQSGWRSATGRVIGGDPGWPDLVLCRVTPPPPRFAVVELKRAGGRVTPEQTAWLADLAACGVETAVWYADDWAPVAAFFGVELLA